MFPRNLEQLKFALAMVGLTGFAMGTDSFVSGANPSQSSADEVEIRMADDSSNGGRAGGLIFRSARRPIVVPVMFEIIDGGPRMQADALEVVLGQLRDHPRRLITIEVEGQQFQLTIPEGYAPGQEMYFEMPKR